MTMMYVKHNGVISTAATLAVEQLLDKSGKSCIEDSLEILGYYLSVHIGRESVAELELHINQNPDADIAAVAFVTLGDNYEAYLIETRHAAIQFVKEYSTVIRDICDLTIK